jgi:DNA-binding MarR family transcriptional regulator
MPVPATTYRALAEFRYQLRCFLRFSEEAARAAGLEPQQHQALLALKGLPSGMRPTEQALATRLQLRHHSVVELVDRLERQKLVQRRRSTSDARAVELLPTQKAERLLDKLAAQHRAELEVRGIELIEALSLVLDVSSRVQA